jgi:hypothetical protein
LFVHRSQSEERNMTQNKSFVRAIRAYAFIAVACLAVGGAGAFAAHRLSVESELARNLVNQGQADLARGDRARAILTFERARLLAPRSDVVRGALAAAGARDPAPSIDRVVSWISPREWFSLTVVFGWVAGMSLAVAIARERRSSPVRRLALGSGMAFVLSMAGLLDSSLVSRALAVVTGPTGMLVAPYDAAGASADLQPGAVVVMGARYGGFVQVRGPADARGWVSSSVVEPVVAASI